MPVSETFNTGGKPGGLEEKLTGVVEARPIREVMA
jgi:hypothetical protein